MGYIINWRRGGGVITGAGEKKAVSAPYKMRATPCLVAGPLTRISSRPVTVFNCSRMRGQYSNTRSVYFSRQSIIVDHQDIVTGGSGRGGHPWAPLGRAVGAKSSDIGMACAHKPNTNCSELLPMYTYTIIFFCILIVCLFVVWVGPWVLQDAFIVVHLRVFDKYLRRWSRLASGSPLRGPRQPDMLT